MEFKSFFKFSLRVFNIIGLDLMEDWTTLKDPGKIFVAVLKKCYFWFLLISLIIFLLLSGVFGYKNFKNLELSAGSTANFILLINVAGRAIVIWFKRSSIVALMKELKNEFSDSIKDGAEKTIAKSFRGFDKYQKINAAVIVSAGFLFGIGPALKIISSGSWDLKLPHQLWFPFEIVDVFTYVILYIFLEFLSLSAEGFIIATDLIFNAIIVVLALEFDILANEFEKIDKKTTNASINKLVQRHMKLLDISLKLEEIFSVSNFILFIGSSLLLCFPAFLVVSSDESFTVLKFAFFFVAALMQIFRLCCYGEKLRVSSLKVADNVVSGKWYHCNESVQKSLLLVLLRAQRPAELMALKFTKIKIETFSSVNYSRLQS